MFAPKQAERGDFWELMHAALGLQHNASQLADRGQPEDAAFYERQAIALLLEATCLLGADEPAMATVRQLATAGLARLHDLKRLSQGVRPRRATASQPRRAKSSVGSRPARVRAAGA
jgi:hypothetical protein